jgi:peroxiredoxin
MQPALMALVPGEKTPEFSLPATDGRTYTPASFEGQPYLAIVFLANHCPYVGAWEDRLIAIAREYAGRGVAFAAISSSDAEKFRADSFDNMRERAERNSYPFPYLYDEAQTAARAFGATRTPEVFLFDRERRLVYHGAIDSDWEEGEGTEPYLRDALDQALAGQPISRPQTRPEGCSLKLKT